jgi:hypothetical protein
MFGCKQDPRWEPPRPIEKLVGWHLRRGWQLDGGFHSYSFERDTLEQIAAVWRACEIRDAGLRLSREARAGGLAAGRIGRGPASAGRDVSEDL